MPKDVDLADPAPLGLIGFGLTTFIVGLIEAKWLTSKGAMDATIPLALMYGGTIQLFAGLLSWRNGHTFGLVGFCTYGAFWWWFGLTELFSTMNILDPSTTTMGVILIGFGVITTYLWIGTFNLNWGLWSVFLTLALTYYFIGFGDWLSLQWATVVGGYLAMATALLAAYVSFAEVTNWSFGQDRVPLGDSPFGDVGSDSRLSGSSRD